jgi:peptidoglycan/LPS O-acetylase OafA/YrhL
MRLLTIAVDKKRIFGLDIIRALAIFFVVLGHGAHLLPAKLKAFIFLLPFPDGVTVFFVLSGFLIGGILIKVLENEPPSYKTLFNFWTKRWLRTLPAYFLILILLISLSIILVKGFSFFKVANYFIFSQNFNTPHPQFFIEAWSLAVEEWFYLLIPSIIFILTGLFKVKPQKAVLATVVSVITATIIFRYYRYLTIPVTSEEVFGAIFRGQVVTRLDSLMFGVAGAYFYYYHPLSWIKYKSQTFVLGITTIILIGIIPQWLFPKSVFYFCNISFIVTAFSILLVLPFLSQLKTGKGVWYKCITYTSLISYSMYLTHASLIMVFIIPKISFLQSAQPAIIAARFVLYWVLTYVVSILMYKFVEVPFMAMRHKKISNKMVTKNSF